MSASLQLSNQISNLSGSGEIPGPSTECGNYEQAISPLVHELPAHVSNATDGPIQIAQRIAFNENIRIQHKRKWNATAFSISVEFNYNLSDDNGVQMK